MSALPDRSITTEMQRSRLLFGCGVMPAAKHDRERLTKICGSQSSADKRRARCMTTLTADLRAIMLHRGAYLKLIWIRRNADGPGLFGLQLSTTHACGKECATGNSHCFHAELPSYVVYLMCLTGLYRTIMRCKLVQWDGYS